MDKNQVVDTLFISSLRKEKSNIFKKEKYIKLFLLKKINIHGLKTKFYV